jgi:hypothetical protein
MKKLILLAITAITLLSCNESSKKQQPSDTKDTIDSSSAKTTETNTTLQDPCVGRPNVYVPEPLAIEMTNLFKTEYIDKLTTARRSFKASDWMDKTVILAFQSALYNNSNGFDGVRVYYGATNTTNSNSLFLLVPTKPGNRGDNHPNVWGNTIQVTNTQFRNFNLDYITQAKSMIESFRGKFKDQTNSTDPETAVNKGLSSAVWVDKCVFAIMKDFLTTHPDYDGFRMHAAAYPTATDVSNRPPGHFHDKQSTVLFVPTRNTSDHKDDFKVLTESDQPLTAEDHKKKWLEALNHGELCPRKCPVPEN